MLRFILIFVIVIQTYYAYNLKIAYGVPAKEGEFPFMVGVVSLTTLNICGGTILNEKFILTAAHCVCNRDKPLNAQKFIIKYGSLNLPPITTNVIDVAKINCHNFDDRINKNDIAVLELAHALPRGGNWKPVELAKSFDLSREQTGVIAGWGINENGKNPKNLSKSDMRIYTEAACDKVRQRPHNHHYICIGKPVRGGACPGDSGGPLMANGKQIGVLSAITDLCANVNRDTPNVVTRVSNFYNWIINIINKK